MSAEVREHLAQAARSVPGVRGAAPYYTQTTTPGHVFVRLDRIEYPNPFGGLWHWNVVLVLPQDMAAAEKYLEQVTPDLVNALQEHLVIREVLPQRLSISGVGELPCVFINGHREE